MGAHFGVFENLLHDAVGYADTAVGGGVAFDVFAAVQTDAGAGEAHPVFERGPDVLGFGAVVFASVTSPDEFAVSVEFSEDRRAFVGDLFGDLEVPFGGVFVTVGSGVGFDFVFGTGGAWGVDGDLFADEKLNPLLGEIDDNVCVVLVGFFEEFDIFVDGVAPGVAS